MSKKGSIFSDDDDATRPIDAKPKTAPQIQPMAVPKRKFRITYPVFRDIVLALVFLVALPLEMFAPEMYKPSTWIGNRLGLLAGEQQLAASDDAIEVQNKTALGTADAQAAAQTTITRGTADANIDVAAEQQATSADVQLQAESRQKAVMSEIDQQINLSNRCEMGKFDEYVQAEARCTLDEKMPYGVCLEYLEQIKNRECTALPDPDDYPENLREYVSGKVGRAKNRQDARRKQFEGG